MALMIPRDVGRGTSSGEVEIFNLLKNDTNSRDYVCLHSVGIARHQRKEYAEADFIVVGPSGIFCLEVKGGDRVERKDGLWIIGSSANAYRSAEGPFKQAQSARWALLNYLKERLDSDIRNTTLFGWGVMFPKLAFIEQDPEWDNDVVYDVRDKTKSALAYFDRLEAYFRRRMSETNRRQPSRLSAARVKAIVDCLRGDFEVVQSFNGLLADSRRELVTLSPAQFGVLDSALNEFNPRILCIGAAGTGKTLVAMEAAKRLAESGNKVLLLCFNNNLGRFLSREIILSQASVRVSTVYRLLHETILNGGFGRELATAKSTVSDEELFNETYPNLFDLAATKLLEENDLPQYDVLIVDEAQDILSASAMNCLDVILDKGFAKGRWLIFLDDGLQSHVYGRVDQKVISHLRSLGPAGFVLDQNFRNPKHIVSEMCALTRVPMPTCKRELQSNVDYRTYRDNTEQAKKLRAIVVELLRQDVSPSSITVLSVRNMRDAVVAAHPLDVGKPIVFLDNDMRAFPDEAITAATVAGFKGLENDFIILTDVTLELLQSDWGLAQLYVGMTRARTKLFVLVDEFFLQART